MRPKTADIINRIDEQRYLLNFLKSKAQENKLLILHSPSGVGKSYLVERVVSQLSGHFYYAAIGRTTKYDGATYIQQLAGVLNDVAKETGTSPTISQFQHSLQHEDAGATLKLIGTALEPIAQVATAAATPATLARTFDSLRGFLSYFTAAETPDNEIVSSKTFDAIKLSERYARYIIGTNDVILRVNSYNDIDEESDFYLRSLYSGSRNLTLILEITQTAEEEDSTAMRLSISDRFPEGSIDCRRVDKVDVRHVIEYYEPALSREAFNVPEFVEDAFTSSEGNFRRFGFLLHEKLARPLSENFASTEERITVLLKEMPTNCKRILALATATSSRLDPQSIREIWTTNGWSAAGDLSWTLDTLRAEFGSLVSVDGDTPTLAVEFARDYLLRCPALAVFHIEARRVLLTQLRQENLTSSSSSKVYSNLLCIISLIIQGGGSSDATLLPSSLRDLDLNQYPPDKIELATSLRNLFFEYVYKARQFASDGGTFQECDSVYEEICKILYRIGDIDLLETIASAYSAFLPLEKHNDLLRLTIISAKILNSRENAIDDLEKIDKGNRRLYVGSRLLLILYYRTFGFLRKAKREWKRLRKEADSNNIPFRGLLYEYGALTHPINIFKRIRFLREAKAYHRATGNNFHLVTCSLAIASTYFHLPLFRRLRLRLAQKEMDTTSQILPGIRVMDHIFENYTAAVQVQSGEWRSDIVEKLMFAYDRCALKPDKLLIGANLIDCHIALRQRGVEVSSIAVYAKDILSISRVYQNRHSEFALYALSACYRYFKSMDDRRTSRELEDCDLANMPIQLSFYNFGRPRNLITKLFVRWIYSRLYVIVWPRVQPVFNWSADFYSFEPHS